MRAAVLRGVNEKFEIREDVTIRGPGPGEVRVRLGASGVCHTDLSIHQGLIGSPAMFPCVLGHEGAGTVTELGLGVSRVAEGDHVIVAWVAPCGSCRTCLAGQTHLCLSSRARRTAPRPPQMQLESEGIRALKGGFAEEMVIQETAAVKIPADIPFDIAALVGCGVTTGFGAAINTAAVTPGSWVVVIGCGGVGLNVIQGSRVAGASCILAVDPTPAKQELARSFGATHAVHPDDLDEARIQLTDGIGFDYAFEAVGRPATVRAAYDATRVGGATIVVGAGSPTAEVVFNGEELFDTERKILGCHYGSANVHRDFPLILELWRAGRVELEGLVSRRIGLEDLDDAFEALDRGEVVRSMVLY
jgi:S-(hydroxymethyl)glutathione dehydrogenase / alcohol dehydrogenase